MPSSVYYGKRIKYVVDEEEKYKYTIQESIKYAYDRMGNISRIDENGAPVVWYKYDALNRLIREDNKAFGKTWLYSYDNNGNILCKRTINFTLKENVEESEFESVQYEYDGDKLLSYGTEICDYDAIGNPKTYRGKKVEWANGRQMVSYNGTAFTYDGLGRRISKGEISYIYDSNNRIIKQSNGIEFIYDNTGVAGIVYSDATYMYRKDAQGNIVGLIDNNGNVVVEYKYDAWGDHNIILSEPSYENLAKANPFRYRGYYYDEGIGLYYLKSRYYDPEVGRFITIDDISYIDPETINGLNLYAYCGNNPVMRIDPNGTFFWFFFAAIMIGAAIGGTLNGISAYNDGQRGWGLFGAIAGGAIMGGAMGGILALGGAVGVASAGLMSFGMTAGTAFGVSLGVGAAAGMVSYSLENGLRTDREWSVGGMFKAGFAGALKGGATFWIGFFGGKNGAFDKLALERLLGKELVKDSISYGIAKGLLSAVMPGFLRNLFTWSSFYLGETLTKLLFISSVASGTRWLIDQIFGL